MAQTNDVALCKQSTLINQLAEKHSKKGIEDFFGLVIKEVDKENFLYNLYKDGELVFAMIPQWDIEHIFRGVAKQFVELICSEADKEENLEETERKFNELEAMELENERENYYTCPVCYAYVKRGTHFH